MIGRRAKASQEPGINGANPGMTVPPRKKRRTLRGVLWIIALMFATSAVLRLGGETGQAIASGLANALDTPLNPGEAECPAPPDIAAALDMLATREAMLVQRELALADRMQALSVAEAQVARNLAALQEAEASLEATMALSATAAEDDLARLTTVYENMKPKDAAPLFAAMSPEFAAGFLGRMRPDAAAAILSKIDPAEAYSISVLLAGRNAQAPTE